MNRQQNSISRRRAVPKRGVGVLCLASRSPRRLQLLAEGGYSVTPVPSGVDDAILAPRDIPPTHWTMALAYLKAFAAAIRLNESCQSNGQSGRTVVIGADTVVECDGEIIGQPRDEADALRILNRLNDAPHRVITGVAVLDPVRWKRVLFEDEAAVDVGRIPETEIAAYLKSGRWQGKAGAYNLSERLEAGWPIEYRGDPTTIMGLPMKRLAPCLEQGFGIIPE